MAINQEIQYFKTLIQDDLNRLNIDAPLGHQADSRVNFMINFKTLGDLNLYKLLGKYQQNLEPKKLILNKTL